MTPAGRGERGSARRRAFRTRGALAQHQMRFGPNMTPMVDVVMVILVFFMASASFIGPEWLLQTGVEREAEAAEGETDPAGLSLDLPGTELTIVLRMDDAGRTRAKGFGVADANLGVLARAIEAAAPELNVSGEGPSVRLDVGPGVPWEDVVRVHETCLAAGITRVAL